VQWKQRPALGVLERLQLLAAAALFAWCQGEMEAVTARRVMENYGAQLAR